MGDLLARGSLSVRQYGVVFVAGIIGAIISGLVKSGTEDMPLSGTVGGISLPVVVIQDRGMGLHNTVYTVPVRCRAEALVLLIFCFVWYGQGFIVLRRKFSLIIKVKWWHGIAAYRALISGCMGFAGC